MLVGRSDGHISTMGSPSERRGKVDEHVGWRGSGSFQHQLVTDDGSPLPRSNRSQTSYASPKPQSFGDWGGEESGISWAGDDFPHARPRSDNVRHDECLPAYQAGWKCNLSCCRSAKSATQAYCRTATPSPSENGIMARNRCDGCWGCDDCCTPWPIEEVLLPEAEEHQQFRGPFSHHEHLLVNPAPRSALVEDCHGYGSPPAKQEYLSASLVRAASHLASVDRASDNSTPATTSFNGRSTAARNKSHHKKNSKTAHVASEGCTDPGTRSSPPFEPQPRKNVPNPERKVEQRLAQLDVKITGLGHAPSRSNAQNNVASVIGGSTHGQGLSPADLDLRDLSKQVLKMNLYEKFKREQSLTDRLARIKESFVKESADARIDAPQTDANVKELEELRYYLTLQGQEIQALKNNTGLMPEVRGDLVKLSDELLWTRDRLNELENTACQRQRPLLFCRMTSREGERPSKHTQPRISWPVNPVRPRRSATLTLPRLSNEQDGEVTVCISDRRFRLGNRSVEESGATAVKCSMVKTSL